MSCSFFNREKWYKCENEGNKQLKELDAYWIEITKLFGKIQRTTKENVLIKTEIKRQIEAINYDLHALNDMLDQRVITNPKEKVISFSERKPLRHTLNKEDTKAETEVTELLESQRKWIQHLELQLVRSDLKLKNQENEIKELRANTQMFHESYHSRKSTNEKEDTGTKEKVSSLHKTILHLEEELKSRDFKIEKLEETLHCKENDILGKIEHRNKETMNTNEQLEHMLKEKNEQIILLKDNHEQTLKHIIETKDTHEQSISELKNEVKSLEIELMHRDDKLKYFEENSDNKADGRGYEEEADIEEISTVLEKKIQQLESEVGRRNEKIRNLNETLDHRNKEISNLTEQLLQITKENDDLSSKLSETLQQTSKRIHKTEMDLNQTISALERENESLVEEVKLRNANIDNLEKEIENKNISLYERIDQLENTVKEKDDKFSAQRDQHQQVVTSLHKKKSNLEENIITLKEKNQHLSMEVERFNEKTKWLEETLENKKKETSDINEKYEKEKKEHNAILSEVNDLRQRTNKTYDSEAEYGKTIKELEFKIQSLDKEMKLRDDKVKHLEKMLENQNIKQGEMINQLENTVKEKDNQLSAHMYQHQQEVKIWHEKESELEENVTSLKKKIQNLKVNAQRLVSKIKDLKDQLKKTKIVAKEGRTENIPAMENKIADLNQHLKQTRTKLHETETELNETKTRLSKAMGERLTDNNPNITDLGDTNRPTKLAERFIELYDNQWTDAFDILEKKFKTEEEAIEALLHILQDAMRFCKTKEREQMVELRRVLVFADKTVPTGDVVDIQKLFKDSRKAMAPSAVENLFQAYEAHIRRSTDVSLQMAMEVKSYVKECLELCWFMTVQDPPVVFAPLLKRGVPFNKDLFRPYTQSGSNVAFVVWPALLLHDHGPVLAKGVAQGTDKKPK